MNLVEQSDSRNDDDIRYELSPVLCQFIGQDISKNSLELFMKEIISHYVGVVKDVYRLAAFCKEEPELNDDSPAQSNYSPRKLKTFRTAFSFNQSMDSMSLE